MPTPYTPKRHHSLPNGKIVHLRGWRPDRPDHRDGHYARPYVSIEEAVRLPVDFLDQQTVWADKLGVWNQGEVGDCTANGSLELKRFLHWKAHQVVLPNFSRLFQYAETRKAEGTPLTEDSGCSVRDAVDTMRNIGCCPENLWPSDDTTRFVLDPTDVCRQAALQHQIVSYHRVPNLLAAKREISNWYPVVFGFSVYESFMSDAVAKTGIVPIPRADENIEGGHCVIAIGYDDKRRAVLCLNSWGEEWGAKGFFWMPYFYFDHHIATDLWVVHTAEDAIFA